MKIAERLALISAGYKKKEIDELEAKESEETAEEKGREESEEIKTYKEMVESLNKEKEESAKQIEELQKTIKEIQAGNRNGTEGGSTEPVDYVKKIFEKGEDE